MSVPKIVSAVSAVCLGALAVSAETLWNFPVETVTTKSGEKIELVLVNHGSIALRYRGKVLQIDPVEAHGRASYAKMPKADVIFVTHEHFDHLDVPTLEKLRGPETVIYSNAKSSRAVPGIKVLANGDTVKLADGISVAAVPAYNTTQGRERFHPKGNGNGYVFTIEDARIYVSGDTEDIPEMAAQKGVDVAFLSANQPYTMTPVQCGRAARMIQPKVVIPYHLSQTSFEALKSELKGFDVRLHEEMR